MELCLRPISERVDWLVEHAAKHASEFCTPDAVFSRKRYLARFPTAIAVMKCMDGRINLPVSTGTPPGIIQPFRNLGGFFDLGWPHLGEVLSHYVHKRIDEGRRVMILVTYHFSRGSRQRGCAGFDYHTDSATAATYELQRQIQTVFGKSHGGVDSVVCGFETDEDALILHGHDGQTLDLSTVAPEQADSLAERLSALLPDLPQQVQHDLLPLLRGNLHRIAAVRGAKRTLDNEHREWMICLGRGFDFLHIPNLALIVGPYSPQLADPIGKAADIIADNIQAGRIADDGFLLFASVPYEEIGSDRARAELKSRFLLNFAQRVIGERHPDLASRMVSRAAVLDWHSRRLENLMV